MIQNLIIVVHLLISNFLVEGLKANKNWQKISLILQYNFVKKNLTHFTNLSSLNIIKSTLQQHSQKPYSYYKLSSKHILKEHWEYTISRRRKNILSLHKNIFVPET